MITSKIQLTLIRIMITTHFKTQDNNKNKNNKVEMNRDEMEMILPSALTTHPPTPVLSKNQFGNLEYINTHLVQWPKCYNIFACVNIHTIQSSLQLFVQLP